MFDFIQSFKSHFIQFSKSAWNLMIEISLYFGSLHHTLTSWNATSIILLLSLLVFLSLWAIRTILIKNSISISPPEIISNFRKRDKVRYYATRFARKYIEITDTLKKIQSKEVRDFLIASYMRRLFRHQTETLSPPLNWPRLPDCFFEPDEEEHRSLPEEFTLMLTSIRLFGQSERGLFMEFCKYIETVKVEKGEYLFRIGDPDAYIYVVYSGKMQLYYKEDSGLRFVVSEISRGGSIDSLIAMLNFFVGNPLVHENIEAVAIESSVVLRLPLSCFVELGQPSTPSLIRILQTTTLRLQRLAVTAVHDYLGLGLELFKQRLPRDDYMGKTQHILVAMKQRDPSFEPVGPSFEPLGPTSANHHSRLTVTSSSKKSILRRSSPSQVALEHNAIELGEAPQRRILVKPPGVPISPSFSLGPNESSTGLQSPSLIIPCFFDSLPKSVDSRLEDHPQRSQLNSPPRVPSEPIDLSGWVGSNGGQLTDQPIALAALRRAAEDDFASVLGLTDQSSLFRDKVSLALYPKDSLLFVQGEMRAEVCLVITGQLVANYTNDAGSLETSTLFVYKPGDTVGALSLVTGEPEVYSVEASVDSVVAVMSREHFYAIARDNVAALLNLIKDMASRIMPLFRLLDATIEWVPVPAGKALYKRDEESSDAYVVLGGRLRQVDYQHAGEHRLAGELGRGDLVGLIEVVCGQRRIHTVIAIRDSDVARIPAQLLIYLKQKVPQVLSRIIKLLSGTLLDQLTSSSTGGGGSNAAAQFLAPLTHQPSQLGDPVSQQQQQLAPQLSWRMMSNLRTIAILPSGPKVNSEAFSLELQHAMTLLGSSIRLTAAIVKKRLGSTALDGVNHYRLSAWLSHQEDLHRMVLFVCDHNRNSSWTKMCIRQADCVLVLAMGKSDPSKLSPVEQTLRNHHTKVAKVLVLLYPIDTEYPVSGQTAKWLNIRPWISHHLHIRCERRVFNFREPERMTAFYSRIFAEEKPNPLSDFSRLARYLVGEAVGLVLGGGGARGCAHIGVIRAFQEAGIPIDMLGGTSMGAFMAALWAEETRVAQFTQRARNFTNSLDSNWNRIKDITYPAVSLFSGKGFNHQLEVVFGDRQIEDLWLPTFYTTTDITACTGRFHTQGSLWRYVRASMSLSGYLPPLCDPYNGNLLLDGGYTNNLPADIMASFGAKTIIAVDVGAAVDTNFTNFGDHLSGWSYVYHRLFGSESQLRVPNLSEIQTRLGFISCVRQLEKVKASGICHYIRPQIDSYSTLQFGAFDEITTVGYDHAKQVLQEWQESGVLHAYIRTVHSDSGSKSSSTSDDLVPTVFSPVSSFESSINTSKAFSMVPQAFIDLAEVVCPSPIPSSHYTDSNVVSEHGSVHLSHRTLGSSFSPELDRSLTFHHGSDRPPRRIASLRQRRKRLYSEVIGYDDAISGRHRTSSLEREISEPAPLTWPMAASAHQLIGEDAEDGIIQEALERQSTSVSERDIDQMSDEEDLCCTPTVESDPEFDYTAAMYQPVRLLNRAKSLDNLTSAISGFPTSVLIPRGSRPESSLRGNGIQKKQQRQQGSLAPAFPEW